MNRYIVGPRGAVKLLGVLAILMSATFAYAARAQGRSVATDRRSEPLAEAIFARPVTVNVTGVSLKVAVRAIAASAGVHIQYKTDLINAVTKPVTLNVTHKPLRDALDMVLEGTQLVAIPVTADQLLLKPIANERVSDSGAIAGKILDARTKQPLAGATVLLDNEARHVLTNERGEFQMANVDVGSHTITVRLLGHGKEHQTVMVQAGQVSTVEIMMEAMAAAALEQVVVTGTVVQTELKAVPSAITVITAKQIEERGITKIDQLFRGDVPGLFAQNFGSANGAAGGADRVLMFSRGASAFNGGRSVGASWGTNPIKTYVDGVEMSDPQYLSQIDPRSIERIEILTGPQASTIYGSNALNGVMQIFTKRSTSSRTQLLLDLQSGWIENNFSPAHAPQHAYSAQLNGIEGRLSYNAGGSWDYRGQWAPAQQLARTGGFGGIRAEWRTPVGPANADVMLRRTITQQFSRGDEAQTFTALRDEGFFQPINASGVSAPFTRKANGQTFGLTLGYRPTSWWAHELTLGRDVENTEYTTTKPGYFNGGDGDTLLTYSLDQTQRQSIRYVTTPQVRLSAFALLNTTLGADAWQSLATSTGAQSNTLSGEFPNSDVYRTPDHNSGALFQTQLGIGDQLFLTYGLRAEWNPAFGKEVQPNVAPRYGIAYTQEIGMVTAKLRASYGRSTRPPDGGGVQGVRVGEGGNASLVRVYGNFYAVLPNPDLLPEHQQGGEGGFELYVGTRGSLVVTRYNQTVDNLIELPVVDSVASLLTLQQLGVNPSNYPQWPDGYAHYGQNKFANLGSIRNQGWELQGSVNAGPFLAKGTYSWTKSRVLRITPAFAAQFPASSYPQYQPGAMFQYLPEHTWATNVSYARGGSAITVNVNGFSQIYVQTTAFAIRYLASARLIQNQYRTDQPETYANAQPAYAIADLNAQQRFSSHIDGVLQVQNLMNKYVNDFGAQFAAIGRQEKLGLRVRW